MDIIETIANELHLTKDQTQRTVDLIDDGNTIPFIARYRKEVTGALDDTTLRTLQERLQYLRNLEKRKEEVVHALSERGKLTDTLSNALTAAQTLSEVEELYRPYKQKKTIRIKQSFKHSHLPKKNKRKRHKANKRYNRKENIPLRTGKPISDIFICPL